MYMRLEVEKCKERAVFDADFYYPCFLETYLVHIFVFDQAHFLNKYIQITIG